MNKTHVRCLTYIIGGMAIVELIAQLAYNLNWATVIVPMYLVGAITVLYWLNRIRINPQWLKTAVMAAAAIFLGFTLVGALVKFQLIMVSIPAPTIAPATPKEALSPQPSVPQKSTEDKSLVRRNCRPNPDNIPCRRIETKVTKINDIESTIRMNGGEKKGVDIKLTLRSGEKFRLEQFFFSERGYSELNHHISFTKWGDYCPIWGGNDFSAGWPVKYKIGRTGNGVVAVVKENATGKEKIFSFAEGETTLTGRNPFPTNAKIILYYNCILSWEENGQSYDGHSRCGWDGSTATLKVTVIPLQSSPVVPDSIGDPENPDKENLDPAVPRDDREEKTGSPNNIKIPNDPNIFEY